MLRRIGLRQYPRTRWGSEGDVALAHSTNKEARLVDASDPRRGSERAGVEPRNGKMGHNQGIAVAGGLALSGWQGIRWSHSPPTAATAHRCLWEGRDGTPVTRPPVGPGPQQGLRTMARPTI